MQNRKLIVRGGVRVTPRPRRLAAPFVVKFAKTLVRLHLVVLNTGEVLDSVECVEFSSHPRMDGFDFFVRREPFFHYTVIMIHRRFKVA